MIGICFRIYLFNIMLLDAKLNLLGIGSNLF